jgi:FkbM family methyltransferase
VAYKKVLLNYLTSKLPPDRLESLIQVLLRKAPLESAPIYEACRDFANRHLGENNDDIHTNGELRLMQEKLPTCDTIFDVGSNIGQWATRALQINPAASLHCFEPSRPTFEKLLQAEFPANVYRNNFGLGSAPANEALHVFEDGAGHNSLYQRRGLQDGWQLEPQARTEMIRLETLDRYCAQHGIEEIDFLKVDVEGHELEVFKGAVEALTAGRIKTIQFEYGGCNIDAKVLLKDIFEFFEPLDYRFYKLHSHGLRPVERYDQRLETFQYQNWAITRKS